MSRVPPPPRGFTRLTDPGSPHPYAARRERVLGRRHTFVLYWDPRRARWIHVASFGRIAWAEQQLDARAAA